MSARIVIGKASGDGGREPTLRDVLRALEELRVEVHQRIDDLAAELVKLRNLDQADERGDGLARREGEVGTEVAGSARGIGPTTEGQRRSGQQTGTSRVQGAESDQRHADEVRLEIVKRGPKVRRASCAVPQRLVMPCESPIYWIGWLAPNDKPSDGHFVTRPRRQCCTRNVWKKQLRTLS